MSVFYDVIACLSAGVVFVVAVLRLNNLYYRHERPMSWNLLEVIGLALTMAACAGVIGERFLPNGKFHDAQLLFIFGCALTSIGASRGALRQVFARLQGWNGSERRQRSEQVATDTRRVT